MKSFKSFLVALVVLTLSALPTFAASITPSSETFDLANPKDWTFIVTDVPKISMLSFFGDGVCFVNEISGFTYDGTTLVVSGTMLKTVLSNHSYAKQYEMQLYPSTVKVSFTLTDSSVKTISPTDVNYDLKNPIDLSFTLKNVDTINSLSYYTQGGELVETSTDFTYSGDTLTIKKEVLSTVLSKDVPSAKSSATVYVYDIKINNEEPTARIYADHGTSGGDSGGGGGCNAGFGALSLLVCLGLFKKRKPSK